jgi:hypothetical protein
MEPILNYLKKKHGHNPNHEIQFDLPTDTDPMITSKLTKRFKNPKPPLDTSYVTSEDLELLWKQRAHELGEDPDIFDMEKALLLLESDISGNDIDLDEELFPSNATRMDYPVYPSERAALNLPSLDELSNEDNVNEKQRADDLMKRIRRKINRRVADQTGVEDIQWSQEEKDIRSIRFDPKKPSTVMNKGETADPDTIYITEAVSPSLIVSSLC